MTNSISKAPTFIAYQVKEGKDKSYFNRVGAAWPNKDGKGINIQLDSLPMDGKITLREVSEE